MTKDIEKVWKNIEDKAFDDQQKIEEEALHMYRNDPKKAKEFLTKHCLDIANKAVAAFDLEKKILLTDEPDFIVKPPKIYHLQIHLYR